MMSSLALIHAVHVTVCDCEFEKSRCKSQSDSVIDFDVLIHAMRCETKQVISIQVDSGVC